MMRNTMLLKEKLNTLNNVVGKVKENKMRRT